MNDPFAWNKAIQKMYHTKEVVQPVICGKCGIKGPHYCIGNQKGNYIQGDNNPCPDCGIKGAHYCVGKVQGCMFDGLDPNKAYGISCPCPKCSVRCSV